MEWIESKSKTKFHNDNPWSGLSIYRKLSRARPLKSHNNSKNDYYTKRHRYNKHVYAISTLVLSLLSPTAAMAADVGGVSATANPIANSSGSVTNQAIQVLQGPYITNTYGGQISCQGPTMNITPYVTGTGAFKRPFELMYNEPVYNNADNDDDGIPDNPGEILYHIPTRTGQQEIYNLSVGLSATWSRPLDKELQELCKSAATTQINLQTQMVANKRLDFEIARLKNCGELMKAGIMFHPRSPYAAVCADVVLTNPAGVVANHTHGLQPTATVVVPEANGTAEDLGTFEIKSPITVSVEEDSSSSDTHSSSPENDSASQGFFRGWRLPWSKPALSQDETPVATDQQEVSQEEQTHQQQSQ